MSAVINGLDRATNNYLKGNRARTVRSIKLFFKNGERQGNNSKMNVLLSMLTSGNDRSRDRSETSAGGSRDAGRTREWALKGVA